MTVWAWTFEVCAPSLLFANETCIPELVFGAIKHKERKKERRKKDRYKGSSAVWWTNVCSARDSICLHWVTRHYHQHYHHHHHQGLCASLMSNWPELELVFCCVPGKCGHEGCRLFLIFTRIDWHPALVNANGKGWMQKKVCKKHQRASVHFSFIILFEVPVSAVGF